MIDYILYLIPGIIAFNLYRTFVSSIPKAKDETNVLIAYLSFSVESYLAIIIAIIIGEKHVDLITDLKTIISISTLTNLPFWKVMIYIVIGIAFPIIWRYLKSLYMKTNNTRMGSVAYTESFMKDVFLYQNICGDDVDVSSMPISKIKSKLRKGELLEFSKPVIIKKGDQVIKGQILNFYGDPWDYKELYVGHLLTTKDDFKVIERTYFDIENDIIIEIYKFSEGES